MTSRMVRNLDEPRLELCSACRGDYQDPDASAIEGESSASADGEERGDDPREEFPA